VFDAIQSGRSDTPRPVAVTRVVVASAGLLALLVLVTMLLADDTPNYCCAVPANLFEEVAGTDPAVPQGDWMAACTSPWGPPMRTLAGAAALLTWYLPLVFSLAVLVGVLSLRRALAWWGVGFILQFGLFFGVGHDLGPGMGDKILTSVVATPLLMLLGTSLSALGGRLHASPPRHWHRWYAAALGASALALPGVLFAGLAQYDTFAPAPFRVSTVLGEALTRPAISWSVPMALGALFSPAIAIVLHTLDRLRSSRATVLAGLPPLAAALTSMLLPANWRPLSLVLLGAAVIGGVCAVAVLAVSVARSVAARVSAPTST
jgi:hypothetical protein